MSRPNLQGTNVLPKQTAGIWIALTTTGNGKYYMETGKAYYRPRAYLGARVNVTSVIPLTKS